MTRAPRRVVVALTAVLWAGAAVSWVQLYWVTDHQALLGRDLLTAWHAELLFAHGAEPYSLTTFVYPPSCVVLLRPLAALTEHQLTLGGLIATTVAAGAAVLIGAVALGWRWWGPTAALTMGVVSLVGAMRGEMPLENVSVLVFLAFALFVLFALRGHWLLAAVAIGLSICIKPLLLPVLIIFVLVRQWRALALAVGIVVALNVAGLALLPSPHEVLANLPSLLNRTGNGVQYNSAWVDVARTFGLPEGATVVLRFATVAAALAAAWLAWERLTDVRLRIVVTSSALLMGEYLAGTLSEYHYMLTLVPLAMTVVLVGSPVRSVTGVLGMAWTMNVLEPPPSLLGVNSFANDSAYRAVGMGLVLVTVIVTLARRGRPSAVAQTSPELDDPRSLSPSAPADGPSESSLSPTLARRSPPR
jgi:arabinofuranan 3-O-arabinosyltransferase